MPVSFKSNPFYGKQHSTLFLGVELVHTFIFSTCFPIEHLSPPCCADVTMDMQVHMNHGLLLSDPHSDVGHMIVQFFYVRICLTIFYNSYSMYLPTNGVPGFPLLFLITSILTGMRDNSVISNSDHLSNTSNIIPLGGNVNLSLLFIFKLDYVWFSCLFWRFGGVEGCGVFLIYFEY